MVELKVIQTKDKIYLSKNHNSYYPRLAEYKFDGKVSEKTYHNDWVSVDSIPTTITKTKPKTDIINYRFELNPSRFELNSSVSISNIPTTLEYNPDDDTEDGFPVQYYLYKSLYIFVCDEAPEEEIDIEFKIISIDTFNGVVNNEPIQYKLEYELVDLIRTEPFLLPSGPCKLSSLNSFNIIREHILRHINRDIAVVCSNYDFCLSVSKNIGCDGFYKEFFTPFTKKAKVERKFVTKRQVKIFETAPDRPGLGVYNNYTRTPEFVGNSYEDLQNNIKTYLDRLILFINQELEDCPHCKGLGVINLNGNGVLV